METEVVGRGGNMVKKVGKYEIGRTIGEGTFGKVKYAVNTETGQPVAIKILDKEKIQKQNMGAQIKKEISIMKMVKHRHIVKLYEVLASRSKIFIVLELITGGELFDKIVSEGRFSEDQARFYFQQLVRGVKHCHMQGVCHRDLKPENLLLDADGNLKISDFGLSALYTNADDDTSRATLLHTTCGTPNYVAPEVLNDRGYDGRAADIWSMGVILFVLIAGFLPFDEPHMSALFRKIQRAEFSYPKWFSPQVKALLDKILVADPNKRITISEIERDPWFTAGGAVPVSVTQMPEAKNNTEAVAHMPSEQDLERAVTALPDTMEAEKKRAHEAVPKMNAFDVVNMFGGMALNRMFLSSDEKRLLRAPQFITAVPVEDVLKRVQAALAEMGATSEAGSGKTVKGKKVTARGEISLTVDMMSLSDDYHIVEITRGRGDLLEYNNFFTEFREKLSGLVLNSDGAAGHK